MPFAKIHPAIHANARPVRRALLAVCLNFCLCLAPSAAVALNNPWQIASTWGAVNSQGPIELANNNATQAAVAWNPCPINMNSSFDLSFTMNFGINQGLCGGDGMSFILQAATNGSPFANGTAGINGEKGFVGIQNSLEVAFDNYPGGYSGWPAYSNIGILTNGDPENSDSDVTGCGIQGAGPKVTGPCFPAASYVAPDIRDGLNHTVEIKWNPSFSLLTVVVDNNPSPPSWTLQNPATYFNGQTSVYFGIGASAGSAKNFQSFTYTGENGQSINCGAFPTPTAGAAPTAIVYGTPACVPTPQNTFTPAPTATAVPPTPTPWPTLCGPVPAFASGGQVPTGGCNNSPYTYAINNSPSGTNQLLVVSIWAATAPTGATYGGKAMTAQGPIVNNIQSWYVQAPPTGTNNLVFTYGGTQCSIFVAYAFYNNVNQTGSPLGTVVNQSNPSAKFSTDTITPSTAYSILQDFTTCSNGGGSITASNSTFIPGNTGDGSGHDLAGDYQSTNGKTPYSFSYSTANAGNWVGQTLEILPITSCITPTFTLTPTMTFTKSFTNTFTLTPTKSSTNTFTLTPTQSSTNTFTLTPTKSFTNTYTLTPTQTSTKTATNTFTQTSTPSLTNSFTFTPTQSSTRTATNTFTQTSTPSSTNSFTFTPTQSSTKTATNTFTPSDTASFSPTPTLSATQTPSKTATSTSTDSPTPSFSPTQSFTLTATPTFSDSPTPSFSPTASFTSTPTPTFSGSPTASDTLTPSFTRTATSTFTDSPTQTSTRTPTATPTASPTSTETKTVTNTYTVSNTPVPVPFQLKIQVFNSAGELVDVLFNGAVGTLPQTLDGMSSALIQGQPFSYPTLNIAGINPIVWNGDNNAGAFVIGGVYEIQAQIVDTFGQITTLSHTVNVMATPDQQSVRIYNSAGELVRQLILGSPVSGASRLILSTGTLLVGAGGAPSPLTITVGTSGGGGTSLQWDGLGSSGLPVQTGVYTVLLVSLESNNAAVVASRTVMVLKGPDGVSALDSAYVAPNPATLPGPVYLFYKPALLQGDWPRVELFDLSGEKVAEADDPGLTGKIDVTARHKLAGGIYLARFQLMRGDLLDKARTLKVAVAR